MTKKHFKAFAARIAQVTDPQLREMLAEVVGEVCQQFNPAFDWARFREACQPKPQKAVGALKGGAPQ